MALCNKGGLTDEFKQRVIELMIKRSMIAVHHLVAFFH